MKKTTLTKIFSIIFFTVSILDIIGISTNNNTLVYIFKPLIIPSLITLYAVSVEKKNKWYILALVFSFLGDVFLIDKDNLFLFGIASFLMSQILYIKIIAGQLKATTLVQKLFAVSPFLIYITILMIILKPNLGEFLIPVIIYGITISIFGIVSLLNYISAKSKIALILLTGAILFILSDSMIALNKFHETESFYGVAIMITYVLAQYLIFRFISNEAEMSDQ